MGRLNNTATTAIRPVRSRFAVASLAAVAVLSLTGIQVAGQQVAGAAGYANRTVIATGAPQSSVVQMIPALHWSKPTPFTYGTPLSPLQLDAGASVLGIFVYSSPAGTVLSLSLIHI